ncbi:hypothetical protein LINGRAHAP2_LOCUS11448 [Linum grandiflorum]
MNDRGKAQQQTSIINNNGADDDSSYCLPCKRHPSSSPSVGICPHCLKERLLSLVCSDCGEHRLSSCSCTSNNNNHHSVSSNLDVGSVGRVSFLIENDASSQSQSHSFYRPNPKSNRDNNNNNNEVLILKRSSSSCVEIKRRKGGGFWKIGRFFTTKRSKNKGTSGISHSVAGIEDRNGDVWVLDDCAATGGGCGGAMVSRSRSLCSFRGGGGGGFFGSEDGTYSGARSSVSGARSSISAARSSGFNGLVFDPDRKSGYSESEPRKSGFDSEKREPDAGDYCYPTRRVFSLREGNFTTAHDSGFIDLKFDSDSKPGPTSEVAAAAEYYSRSSEDGGGTCSRIAVNDRGIKRSRKSFKSWRWIFRQHHSSSNDQHHMGWKKKDGGDQKICGVVKAL